MIGGAPIQMQPGFAQQVIIRNPQSFVPPAATRAVPAVPDWSQQTPPSVVGGPRNLEPKFRAKPDDEPSPPSRAVLNRTIAIPSPEDLGVSNARSAGTDADRDALRRLQNLGADFQLRTLENGFLFVCLLPTTQPGRTHRIEAEAPSRGEAVLRALEEAEKWAGQK